MPSAQTMPTTAIDLLKTLVGFPSLSYEEEEIADFVEGYASEAGLETGRHENNVYASLGEGPNLLLLNSHLDVVPPSADHPYEPFEPTEVDGKLYGRGSSDAKASGAAMLTALRELADEGFSPAGGRIMVALTACEEVGGDYNGLESLRPHLPEISAAIVGEPTQLEPCVAQKGLLILTVHARGHTAHAARAHLGDNAIQQAARDIERLADFSLDRADPFLGAPTIAVTTIEGGSAKNVVPDLCSFTLDVRSTPAYTHEEITQTLDELLESDVEVYSDRLIPVATDPDEAIVKACLEVLPEAEPFGSPTMSDWLFLHDVPTVKMGPGRSTLSHTAEEHIELSEVERAARIYKEVIRAYFSLASE